MTTPKVQVQDEFTFGKHKGQSIAQVAAIDPGYIDWFLAQDWSKERYPGQVNFIVNNFNQASETPAHNKLQAKFLNDDLCFKIVDTLYPRKAVPTLMMSRTFEDSCDVAFQAAAPLPEEKAKELWRRSVGSALGTWEERNRKEWDYARFPVMHAELKPSVGDDFPAILRQVLALKKRHYHKISPKDRYGRPRMEDRFADSYEQNQMWLVVYEQFTATSVSEENVKKMFAASGVHLLPLPVA